MPNEILQNPISHYFWVAGVIVLMLVLRKIVSAYLAGLFYRIIVRWVKGVPKETFVDLLGKPLQRFLVILVTIAALGKLKYPSGTYTWQGISITPDFRILHTTFQQVLESAGNILLILSFIGLVIRAIDFIAVVLEQRSRQAPDHSDHQLILFFKDFFKVLVAINGLLLIFKFGLGLPVGNVITGLSLVGAAIALATRESLENLIASFIIFFDKPFTTGDLVKVHQITGTVEKIGLRSTRIRTEQKTFVTVPNKQMVDSILDNLSLRSQRRGLLLLEVHAATPVQQVQDLLAEARNYLKEQKQVVESSVYLSDIQKNALVVTVEYFTAAIPVGEFNQLRQEVNLALMGILERRAIRLIHKETEQPSEAKAG
ncbi:MAG: mechanosensitive ion channel family protein [Chitinophagaceae bacterium]